MIIILLNCTRFGEQLRKLYKKARGFNENVMIIINKQRKIEHEKSEIFIQFFYCIILV